MSTTRRTAGVHSRKRPLGPNGERICYNCGGPTNFRTLCLPCHKTVTKELHGRLKRKRVEAKPLPLFDGE